MKVLLLLYGHYRSFDRTILSWISSLEECDFDCRFVTFDKIDHSTRCWWHGDTEERLGLSTEQLELLKTYDPNVKILTQEFTQEELNDVYATLPLKVYMYRYTNIKDVLESIDDTKYKMIVISRFDIQINGIKFKNISVDIDAIKIGARSAPEFFKGLAASDLLCAFHPKNKNIFYNPPSDIITKKFCYAEECYTEFYHQNFKVVDHSWEYYQDFHIDR
jgi:hypothetical protein